MVVKFLEQFVLDRAGAGATRACYDPDDGFFYDRLVYPSGESTAGQGADDLGAASRCCRPCRCPAAVVERRRAARQALRPTARRLGGERRLARSARVRELGDERGRAALGDRPRRAPARRCTEFFDEEAFLSPHGLRAVSKRYEGNPYTLDGRARRVDRLRAGRVDDRHVRRQLELARAGLDAAQLPRDPPVRHLPAFFGDDFTLEYPTGSGQQLTFGEIAQDLADRLVVDLAARRRTAAGPLYGGTERLQTDPAWKDNLFFNEYFHGDNGAGLGATHQTGWTALVADLILDPPSTGLPERGRGIVPPAAAGSSR